MGGSPGRDPVLRPGDLVEGRYRIIKTLGEGGMGTVFLAEHTLIKRKVALKVLHAELATDSDVVERFMNEARAAGTLGHPNIVESTDMGFTHEAVPYIAFEYLEGALLTDEIYRVGGFPVRRAIFVAQQIASALEAAHNANIIHRDLKSDNVFLTDKDDAADHVKVLDFGISRFLQLDDEKTRAGMVMGTPEFMAPEQISDPSTIDKRVDIYALGVILYEMLTARRPFSGEDDPRTLMHRIVNEEPPPLQRTEVPHGLEVYILDRLLAKDRDERPESMLDVEAALATFTTQDGLPRRRSRPIAAATPDDAGSGPHQPSVRAATRPGTRAATQPGVRAELPARMPIAPRKPIIAYALAAGGLALGALGLVFALTREVPTKIVKEFVAAPALPPPPADAPLAKIAVVLDAAVSDARITFRRRVTSAPTTLELTPSDVLEVVEVAAPDHRTTRYWVAFDRPRRLVARPAPGDGFVEATDDETLVALGEKPPPVAPPIDAGVPDAAPPAAPKKAAPKVAPKARAPKGRPKPPPTTPAPPEAAPPPPEPPAAE